MADRALIDPVAPRSGRVDVRLKDGRTVTHFTRFPPGAKENPLSTDAVNAKARELMAPVLGASRTETLISRINALENVASVRTLMRLGFLLDSTPGRTFWWVLTRGGLASFHASQVPNAKCQVLGMKTDSISYLALSTEHLALPGGSQ